MPKVKTNCAAKKRFKLTATGKIKRKHNLVKSTLVEGANMHAVKELLAMR